MFKIERIALDVGADIDKPLISKEFEPLPIVNYITYDTGGENYLYPHHKEVVASLFRYLNLLGIEIVQIGDVDSEAIQNPVIDKRGISYKKTHFLISNAILHVGNDNSSATVANLLGKSCVAVSGSEKRSLWSPEDSIVSNEHNTVKFPSSNDVISPDFIVKRVLSKIGIDDYNIETLFIGKHYENFSATVIPNFPIDTSKINSSFFEVDISLKDIALEDINSQNMFFWCDNYNISLTTKGKFAEEDLLACDFIRSSCKKTFIRINHEVTKDTTKECINNLKRFSGPYALICNDDIETYLKISLDFFDEKIYHEYVEQPSGYFKKMFDDVIVRSRRAFIADGDIFLSRWHWKNKNISPPDENGYYKIKVDDSLWRYSNYIIIKKYGKKA